MSISKALLVLVLLAPIRARAETLTARQVIARIQEKVGLPLPWKEDTVDTFKAGDPDTPVTGIATTVMATFDVLKRAAAAGKNLVITHEPTFYDHRDKPEGMPENDAVWTAKRDFIAKNKMVVWRFHDFWHARKPDGIAAGMTRVLGWEKFRQPEQRGLRFKLPETTLEALALDLSKKLDIDGIRVVGDPKMKVQNVSLSPGYGGMPGEARKIAAPGTDVVVVGETREWESVEYLADAVTAGQRKAMIILGHIPSEQAGMDECATWLKTFVTEVPVQFVPAQNPFWTPKPKPRS